VGAPLLSRLRGSRCDWHWYWCREVTYHFWVIADLVQKTQANWPDVCGLLSGDFQTGLMLASCLVSDASRCVGGWGRRGSAVVWEFIILESRFAVHYRMPMPNAMRWPAFSIAICVASGVAYRIPLPRVQGYALQCGRGSWRRLGAVCALVEWCHINFRFRRDSIKNHSNDSCRVPARRPRVEPGS
jgi:hypothetical protein